MSFDRRKVLIRRIFYFLPKNPPSLPYSFCFFPSSFCCDAVGTTEEGCEAGSGCLLHLDRCSDKCETITFNGRCFSSPLSLWDYRISDESAREITRIHPAVRNKIKAPRIKHLSSI
ncbi:hypothetical protein FQA47_010441 [Oryzias melastigma]|uniref:Uncharacterized protein n=1 Tax=Oryzias melastigma TaxID=30732 RepID=A0A834F184_ORYME|nr:hypothetical protein FQA47_010441 [Oryzias melastigma]